MLRDYQQNGVDLTFDYIMDSDGKSPCLVYPTGAGKSHVIAYMTKKVVKEWGARALMLCHVKELIEQNYEKLKQHWPNAPAGIYSASVGRKDVGYPITYAGIQSVRKKANDIGHIDFIFVDECHLINHKEEGAYRLLINELKSINPHLIVIGLTATPWRLGHGLITDDPAIFDDIIEPVSIQELVARGYLANLKSKCTDHHIDVKGVKKRGGEFIESQLQKAVNTDENNIKIVEETIKRAGDRKAWLFFCTGVDHAQEMADILNACGVRTACLTGKHTKAQRESIITAYKEGYFKALTNANVLTTGFDYPDIDLIVLARPTMSLSLYMQMVGRGMRLKSHTDHCLVLDFAGIVAKHGPVTDPNVPRRKGESTEDAPMKPCPECHELLRCFDMTCHSCGYEFPKEEKKVELHNDDIMGIEPEVINVSRWRWSVHTSRTSGNEMVKVGYYGSLGERPVFEYFAINNEGKGGQFAIKKLLDLAEKVGANGVVSCPNMQAVAGYLDQFPPPVSITVVRDGKFKKVVSREFNSDTLAIA